MLLNNLKTSIRSLRKNKVYSVVNTVGLAVGIAAALMIFQIVQFESSFNQVFDEHDNIVRVVQRGTLSDGSQTFGVCTPIPAMDAMEQSIGQFKEMSRIRELWGSLTVPDPNYGPPLRKFATQDAQVAFFVENSFFNIFNFEWLSGDPTSSLTQPGSIVLTRSWAEKCFDDWRNAQGKTLMLENLIPVRVEGVIDDLPSNTDFPLQYLVSYETFKANGELFFYSDDWGSCSSNNQVFALLQNGVSMDQLNEELASIGATEYSERNNGKQERFHMAQPLSDIHYDERFGHSGSHQMSRSRIRILSLIGALILIMACFNFINLATAQASLRAKEVGVRKTLGGHRFQLVNQFMTETASLVFISLVFGCLLASLCVPLLAHVSHVPLDLPLFGDTRTLLFVFAIFLTVTLVSGLYPALLLSGYRPATALYEHTTGKNGGNLLRKSLVVLQFGVAQTLIIGALIIILQMDYIQSKDLGFKKDLVYTFGINNDSLSIARQSELKFRLLELPTVENVSFSSDQPLSGNTWATNFRYADRPEDEPYALTLKFCDDHYADTYGLELVAGSWYEQSDTMRDAVVNETLLNKLGVENAQEVVGQTLTLGSSRPIRIVGVTKDFHTHSLRREHLPLLMTTRKSYHWEAGVKIHSENLAQTISSIRGVYDRVYPEQVMTGRFLDERIERHYEDDQRLSRTSKAFGLLAILISCLGLFGLATHAANRRIKEIGIRKVLGSSIAGIIALLASDFIKLVLIAMVLATPLGYYVMSKWLANFEYGIDIQWWVFVATGILAMTVAFLTVSYQSIKAAMMNPIQSLRRE